MVGDIITFATRGTEYKRNARRGTMTGKVCMVDSHGQLLVTTGMAMYVVPMSSVLSSRPAIIAA